jgi:hypothetical protein
MKKEIADLGLIKGEMSFPRILLSAKSDWPRPKKPWQLGKSKHTPKQPSLLLEKPTRQKVKAQVSPKRGMVANPRICRGFLRIRLT